MVNATLFGYLGSSQASLLFLGVAAALFVTSSQLFLQAKDYDIFSIPESYKNLLKDDCEMKRECWDSFEDKQTEQCRRNEMWGRNFYNSAILFMFIGIGFSIVGYNLFIAFTVAGLGIGFECWQWYRFHASRKMNKEQMSTSNKGSDFVNNPAVTAKPESNAQATNHDSINLPEEPSAEPKKLWVADIKEQDVKQNKIIDETDFEETRRCLLDSYHSYVQNHVGYIVALVIGLVTIISTIIFTFNALLQTIIGTSAFLILLIGIGIMLFLTPYNALRIAYWSFFTSIALTIPISLAARLFNDYNRLNQPFPNREGERAPNTAIIQYAIIQAILEGKENNRLSPIQRLAIWSARVKGDTAKKCQKCERSKECIANKNACELNETKRL